MSREQLCGIPRWFAGTCTRAGRAAEGAAAWGVEPPEAGRGQGRRDAPGPDQGAGAAADRPAVDQDAAAVTNGRYNHKYHLLFSIFVYALLPNLLGKFN